MTADIILTRIAEALERLSPQPQPAPRDDAPAYIWHNGALVAVDDFKPISIDLLTGIDAQKAAVVENTRRLAMGHAAHDVLLWGAKGTGKSALTKASVAMLQAKAPDLRLIEVSNAHLDNLAALFGLLGQSARPSVVFIDDLGFDDHTSGARHLRSVLEGGIAARPTYVRLYVTSNRRHILPRSLDEQDSAINPRDVVDDKLALVDRFGLSLGFHVCDQDQYLMMVETYARHLGLSFDRDDALLWSTQRGARSGRVAWHYAVELAGRAGTRV